MKASGEGNQCFVVGDYSVFATVPVGFDRVDELTAAVEARIGAALSIVEDELRREFGDVGIDWG